MNKPGTTTRRLAVAAVATLSLGLAACGSGTSTSAPSSSSSGGSSAPASAATDGKVQIKDFTYIPAKVTVKAGTPVAISNGDNQPHTVTSDDSGKFDSGSIPASGSPTAPITVTTPGTYAFHCSFHPFMRGTLVVQ